MVVRGLFSRRTARYERGIEVATLVYSLNQGAKLADIEPDAYMRPAARAAVRKTADAVASRDRRKVNPGGPHGHAEDIGSMLTRARGARAPGVHVAPGHLSGRVSDARATTCDRDHPRVELLRDPAVLQSRHSGCNDTRS
jgi:hypothetical protein